MPVPGDVSLTPTRSTVSFRAPVEACPVVLPPPPDQAGARALIAAAAGYAAARLAPGTPAAPAVAAGCALWWLITAPTDLAPPPGR